MLIQPVNPGHADGREHESHMNDDEPHEFVIFDIFGIHKGF